MLRAGHNAIGQLRNRLRLITGGRVFGHEFEHDRKVGNMTGSRQRIADVELIPTASTSPSSLQVSCPFR